MRSAEECQCYRDQEELLHLNQAFHRQVSLARRKRRKTKHFHPVTGINCFTMASNRSAMYSIRKLYRFYSADDDINDVAAMGGVNLAEESQRILGSTEYVGTQIRSCRDETLIPASPIIAKFRLVGKSVLCYIVLLLFSCIWNRTCIGILMVNMTQQSGCLITFMRFGDLNFESQ